MKYLKSVSVVFGAIIAAANGLAYEGYLPADVNQALSAILSAALVLARYRPGAGASLTSAQSDRPN